MNVSEEQVSVIPSKIPEERGEKNKKVSKYVKCKRWRLEETKRNIGRNLRKIDKINFRINLTFHISF